MLYLRENDSTVLLNNIMKPLTRGSIILKYGTTKQCQKTSLPTPCLKTHSMNADFGLWKNLTSIMCRSEKSETAKMWSQKSIAKNY